MSAGAIAEGRGAIQQLRSEPLAQGDLPQLLTVTGQELARSHETSGNPVIFRVVVEGEKNELEPLLQDEVYRIGRELLRNAFEHSQASEIEALISRNGYSFNSFADLRQSIGSELPHEGQTVLDREIVCLDKHQFRTRNKFLVARLASPFWTALVSAALLSPLKAVDLFYQFHQLLMVLLNRCLHTKFHPMRIVFHGTFSYHPALLADTPPSG